MFIKKIDMFFCIFRECTKIKTNNNNMTSILTDMLNHAILTETICELVRQGGNVNRFGLNNNDITNNMQDEEDEDTYEYWSFGFTGIVGEKLQLQAVTCLTCGHYILDSKGVPSCQNARCNCPHELDGDNMDQQNRAKVKAKNELMNNYDAFDAFVMEMLPDQLIYQDPITQKISVFQDYPNRLCEDVIGEISRFLVV